MSNTKFEVKGLKETIKKLQNLEPKVAKKVVRKTLRTGAKIMQTEVKQNVPVDEGNLRKSLKVKAGKRKKGSISVAVTTSAEDNLYKGDQFYGAFQEFGTSKMQGKHFMEQSFNAKENEARQVMTESLKDLIEEEAKKA